MYMPHLFFCVLPLIEFSRHFFNIRQAFAFAKLQFFTEHGAAYGFRISVRDFLHPQENGADFRQCAMPGEYRMKQRLARIMDTIMFTDTGFKEIACRNGIANVSYLNRLLKKHFGMTPRELCRKYRSAPAGKKPDNTN